MLASITDWVHLGAFVVVFVVTLISAVWVMLAKEVARAAVSLFVCLSGVAGIYFFLDHAQPCRRLCDRGACPWLCLVDVR